jgi:TolA-binding protein
MDPGVIGVFIPIVAIVMGIGIGMLKIWSKHQLQMATIRSTTRVELDQTAQSQFDELRNEIAQLRDTTTKYDMSVEHALQEVRHRLATLESRNGAAYSPATKAAEQVNVLSSKLGG